MKSGVVVREDDEPTGERPGGLIRARARTGGLTDGRAHRPDQRRRPATSPSDGERATGHPLPRLPRAGATRGATRSRPSPPPATASLAPDQRGYGRSSTPEAIEDYDIVHLTDDLLGLLDDLGHEKAVFVGHDWGSMVVWGMSLLHPDRVAGVVGMSVPFIPRGERPPTESMRFLFGDAFFYMLYFQEPGVADADLGRRPGAHHAGHARRALDRQHGRRRPTSTRRDVRRRRPGLRRPPARARRRFPPGSPRTSSTTTSPSSPAPASPAASTGTATSTATGSSLAGTSPVPRSAAAGVRSSAAAPTRCS